MFFWSCLFFHVIPVLFKTKVVVFFWGSKAYTHIKRNTCYTYIPVWIQVPPKKIRRSPPIITPWKMIMEPENGFVGRFFSELPGGPYSQVPAGSIFWGVPFTWIPSNNLDPCVNSSLTSPSQLKQVTARFRDFSVFVPQFSQYARNAGHLEMLLQVDPKIQWKNGVTWGPYK